MFSQVLDRPDHWFEVTLALCLLAQFAHAHGRWLDGFSIIAVMTRLVIPLKLNTRQYTDRRAITKMSMVTERQSVCLPRLRAGRD